MIVTEACRSETKCSETQGEPQLPVRGGCVRVGWSLIKFPRGVLKWTILCFQGLADLVKEHLESGQKCSPQLLLTCPMCDKRICKDMREWVASLP